ncbi:MAG TPA: PP2C family protein-serine/threonine phosphatase [Solirubrobacterales bacterium]|nr:PP2C family protein-serine/threonine phosphatase [Solirubrobacterales bacterium]
MPGGTSRTARIVGILTAVLAVFVALVATGSTTAGIAFFFCIPIGLAAWWFGPRAGLLLAFVSLALFGVADAIHPRPEFALAVVLRGVFFLAVAAAVSWVAERLRTLEHSAEELEAIRAALAPADLPDLPDLDAAAAFVPSELGVSGDFYLLTNGPDGSTVAVVGDVVGHGPAAARLATFIRARFAALAANTSDPAELLTLANTALAERPGRGQELVSAVCVRLRPEEDKVCWARAGHPPPLYLPGLEELPIDGGTFLLGVEERLQLENIESPLEHSDGLVVYTDGATDVRRGKQMLGLEGLRGVLTPLTGLGARVIVGEVERAILAWADRPIRDDLCLVVLRPNRG